MERSAPKRLRPSIPTGSDWQMGLIEVVYQCAPPQVASKRLIRGVCLFGLTRAW
jgi:hypothetical protein